MRGQPKTRRTFDLLALWILFSAWSSLSGWGLSLVGALNRTGYGISFLVLVGALALFGRPFLTSDEAAPCRFRSRRLLPKIWLGLTLLAFLGGLLYHPVNYDYLTYRFPRLLYWSWEQRWHWIPTFANRMNYSGTGFEWLMLPPFVFFRTDRLFFLINFVSYLFLPGLVFAVFRQLGISPRLSWWWMWVLPCGYCYILQAAGAGNDSFAAVYLLASLHYALKAGSSFSSSRNLVLSLLAVGLLTGAKASNLPLLLPWLTAVFFQRGRLFVPCPPLLLAGTLMVAALISFLPIALANIHYTGDYSGDPSNAERMKISHPVSGIAGNTIQLAVDNLSFPLWYKAISWRGLIPAPLKTVLQRDYPRMKPETGEMQLEEGAGVGLGVASAVALMILLRLGLAGSPRTIPRRPAALWIAGAGAIAMLAYMTKLGSESTSRLVAAYYPLLIAGILVVLSLDGTHLRSVLCRIVAGAAMLSAALLVVISPSRPLLPVTAALNALSHWKGSRALVERGHDVYDTYATRYDAFHDIRTEIPTGEKAIGFIHLGDDPEVSLWLPFGSRQVIDLTPDRALAELQTQHIHFVVVDGFALTAKYGTTIDDLLKKWSATRVRQEELAIKIKRGAELWYLIRVP